MMPLRSWALAALMLGTAGCLSHREYRHIYSLDSASEVPMRAETVAERPAIQLQRVLIPDYIDSTDILLRVGAHELHESTTGRFGERLSLGITHALRADLAARLPQYTVALGQSGRLPARQILVNVDAFDVWASGRCLLIADWTFIDGDRGALPSADRGAVPSADRGAVPSADRGTFASGAAGLHPADDAIVAAMADAVRKLADRIALTAEAGNSLSSGSSETGAKPGLTVRTHERNEPPGERSSQQGKTLAP